MNETKELIEIITEGIQEKKGKNIVIADLTRIGDTIFYVVIQINRVLFFYFNAISYFYIRKLKRKQALLGSNLSAINFLRYTVT